MESRTYRVHFEIDELPAGESDDNLSSVDCALVDCFLAGCPPLVYPLVSSNVTDSVRVDLKNTSIKTEVRKVFIGKYCSVH